MIGAYYSTLTNYAIEFDAIVKISKEKTNTGNISGPFLFDEVSLRSNKVGAGFIYAYRTMCTGSYGISLSINEESIWSNMGNPRTGEELKLDFGPFAIKFGFRNFDKKYIALGVSF